MLSRVRRDAEWDDNGGGDVCKERMAGGMGKSIGQGLRCHP